MAKPLTITFEYEDDDGEEIEVTLPGKYEICDECGGHGEHSHAVDGNGITSSEWAEWDDDERETYMSGGYDQSCEVCHGSGKVIVLDADACDPEMVKRYEEDAYADAAYRAEAAYERKMGY